MLDDNEVHEALGTGDDITMTEEERAVVAKILPMITAKALAAAEAKKAKELAKFSEELVAQNKKALDEKIEELRKTLVPPTPEELTTLLNQEYVEFTFKAKNREFTIRELPLATETRVLKLIQTNLKSFLTEVGRLDWEAEGTSVIDRLGRLLELAPGILDVVCECVAICLSPDTLGNSVDAEWVKQTMGSQRLLGVIRAQMEAGRYRDFLSHVTPFIQN